MRFKKALKNKQGFALEDAIIFMLVIFSLCTLIISLALIGHLQVRLEKKLLLNDVTVDQIGEDYLESVRVGEPFSETYENYVCETDGNALTVWRVADGVKKAVVLYVEAELTENKVNVKVWRYSLPQQIQ